VPLWTTTYYLPLDARGVDDLDELDRSARPCDECEEVDLLRGYFSAEDRPDQLDSKLETIDPECWEHVGRVGNPFG
jgi:hypothetical protein